MRNLKKLTKKELVKIIIDLTGNKPIEKKLMRLKKDELIKKTALHIEINWNKYMKTVNDKQEKYDNLEQNMKNQYTGIRKETTILKESLKKPVIIRVGEKNNFNQSDKEFNALKAYENQGKIFVNSNSFNPIKPYYPSIITINPYMDFFKPVGDLSAVKAFRIKMFMTDKPHYGIEQLKALAFCHETGIPALLTFMRYASTKTAEKYSGKDFKDFGYSWKKRYFRANNEVKETLVKIATDTIGQKLVKTCDLSGLGCPACMNCARLTYGTKNAFIKALNLSISGVKDKYGRLGFCRYNCPDCFSKIVCFGKRPRVDKLIINKKMKGYKKT